MKLSIELFLLFVTLIFALIFVALQNVNNDYMSFCIYLLGVFLLLSFAILFLIGEKGEKGEKEEEQKEHYNNEYYNSVDCTQDGSCIIPPDQNNLFPKDLLSLANKSFKQCKSVRPTIENCATNKPCKNINSGCNNENMYPIITPNMPADILTKGQCAICKIPLDNNVEYFSDYSSKENNQLCRHCQIGYCSNGLCSGNN